MSWGDVMLGYSSRKSGAPEWRTIAIDQIRRDLEEAGVPKIIALPLATYHIDIQFDVDEAAQQAAARDLKDALGKAGFADDKITEIIENLHS